MESASARARVPPVDYGDKPQTPSGTILRRPMAPFYSAVDMYYPLVRYRPPPDGASITFKAKPGMWPSPFDVDDRVTVAYNEHDPEDAKIVSFWTLWFLPATLILFGAACLIGGRQTLAKSV